MAIWVTPPVNLDGKVTSIGEINYNVESRMFVFAYPSTDDINSITDTSTAAYNNLVDFTTEERDQFMGSKYIFGIQNSTTLPGTTDVPIKIRKGSEIVDTGLRISSNGQIVGRLKLGDSQKELLIKVQCKDAPNYRNNFHYRSYATVNHNGYLYRLKKGVSSPYKTESANPDMLYWDALRPYEPQFDEFDEYVPGATYTVNAITRTNSDIYQLSDMIRVQYRALSPVPDENYWTKGDEYNQQANNPSLIYTPGETYAGGSFVAYDGNVYFQPLSDYVAPATFVESDWNLIGPINAIEPYQVGTIYNIRSSVSYEGFVYKLTYTQPFIATSTVDTEFWDNVGNYIPVPAKDKTRIFKIMVNTRKSSRIEFKTDENLGDLKIGQQLGDIINKDIELVSYGSEFSSFEVQDQYILNPRATPQEVGGYYPYIPSGLSLSSDGLLCGSALGPVGVYKFKVLARNSLGLEKEKEFTIRIVDGYLGSTSSISLKFSQEFERKWYTAISSEAFHNIKFYRASDANYGLRPLPEIELKRNFKCMLGSTQLTPSQVASYLNSSNLRKIQCRTGNTRFITALSPDGSALYDLVYKEIFVLSHKVKYSSNSTDLPLIFSNECLSLKTSLVALLGSDDGSLTEPYRYSNTISGKDDTGLYRTKPDTSSIGNYSDFVNAGFVINDFLPILPIAYVHPGQGKILMQNIIDDGYVQDTFYDIFLTGAQLVIVPRGNCEYESSVVNLKE